jgi:protein SCO1/2
MRTMDLTCFALLATSVCVFSASLVAGPTFADEKIAELEGVGITEHLDERIPLELTFVDEEGTNVVLGQYFNKDKPVILTLNYYKCPMLCSLTLNGLTTGLEEMDWTLGDEFEVVTLSINPDEKAPLAKKNKEGYLGGISLQANNKTLLNWRRPLVLAMFLTQKPANFITLLPSYL